MDIHKPKPWHGAREFLKEYGIIVLGVLTALGAEQVVEQLHWHDVTNAARAAIVVDQRRLMQEVGATDIASPCALRRLDAIKAALDTAERTGRLPELAPLGPPPNMPWVMRGWDTVVSGQSLPHFPHDLAMGLSAEAGTLGGLRMHRDTFTIQWAALNALSGPGRPIERMEIAGARETLARAYWTAARVRVTADAAGRQIIGIGLLDRNQATAEWKYGADTYAHGVGTVCAGRDPSAGTYEAEILSAPARAPDHPYDYGSIRPGPG